MQLLFAVLWKINWQIDGTIVSVFAIIEGLCPFTTGGKTTTHKHLTA